jgi:cystathionine beta-lyase/cystathionine gamma-synthase
VSIGLENIEDIKNDIKLGFAAAKNA